ncbi:MAG: hypothetical protein AAGE99_01940 [Chlamydiota bacterium]
MEISLPRSNDNHVEKLTDKGSPDDGSKELFDIATKTRFAYVATVAATATVAAVGCYTMGSIVSIEWLTVIGIGCGTVALNSAIALFILDVAARYKAWKEANAKIAVSELSDQPIRKE